MSEKEKFYKLLNKIIKAPVSIPWYIIKKIYISIRFLFLLYLSVSSTAIAIPTTCIYLFYLKIISIKLSVKSGLNIPTKPLSKWFCLFISISFIESYRRTKINYFLIPIPLLRAEFKKSVSASNYLRMLDDEENTEALEMEAFDLTIEEYKANSDAEIRKKLRGYREEQEEYFYTTKLYIYTLEKIQRERQEKINREALKKEESARKEEKLDNILKSLNDL